MVSGMAWGWVEQGVMVVGAARYIWMGRASGRWCSVLVLGRRRALTHLSVRCHAGVRHGIRDQDRRRRPHPCRSCKRARRQLARDACGDRVEHERLVVYAQLALRTT